MQQEGVLCKWIRPHILFWYSLKENFDTYSKICISLNQTDKLWLFIKTAIRAKWISRNVSEVEEKIFYNIFLCRPRFVYCRKNEACMQSSIQEVNQVIIIIGFPFLTKSWEMSLTDFRRLGIKMSKASKRIATHIALMQQCCNTGTEETKIFFT